MIEGVHATLVRSWPPTGSHRGLLGQPNPEQADALGVALLRVATDQK